MVSNERDYGLCFVEPYNSWGEYNMRTKLWLCAKKTGSHRPSLVLS